MNKTDERSRLLSGNANDRATFARQDKGKEEAGKGDVAVEMVDMNSDEEDSNVPAVVRAKLPGMAPAFICKGDGVDNKPSIYLHFIYYDRAQAEAAAQKLFTDCKIGGFNGYGKPNQTARPLRVIDAEGLLKREKAVMSDDYKEANFVWFRMTQADYKNVAKFGDAESFPTRSELQSLWREAEEEQAQNDYGSGSDDDNWLGGKGYQ